MTERIETATQLGISVGTLFCDPELESGLVIHGGRDGMQRLVKGPETLRPSLVLTGYQTQLEPDHIIVLGATEIGYLQSLSDRDRTRGIDALLSQDPACIVVTRDREPPEDLRERCDTRSIPLFITPLATGMFIDQMRTYLDNHLSPYTSTHGVLLDVIGVGILLLGKSGIGKSETALDLLVRGHRLVADDIVNIHRRGTGFVFGSGGGIIHHHMEIRGLGIINIKDLFGIAAVRDAKRIELVCELVEWDSNEEYDRLGLDEAFYRVLGTELPKVTLPVRPGRNMATIIEVAARNQLLKFQGHNSAREFQQQLTNAIAQGQPMLLERDQVE